MAYKIKKGKRQIAIAMCQVNFSVNWANIFIDCMNCDESFGLKFDSRNEMDLFPDEKFIDLARKHNWVVIPGEKILCPKCNH